MGKDNKGYWQLVAKLYASIAKNDDPLYQKICENITPELTQEMNVLELACGTGQLSYPLSPKVRVWEATDFSENMIAEAKKKSTSAKLRFSVQDATNLPYPPDSFDAVVIANALHIMPEPEKALAEIFRVLRPGGMLYAPTIVWGECKKGNIFKTLLNLSGIMIYHNWDCEALSAFVAKHGFVVKKNAFLPHRSTPMCYLSAMKGDKAEAGRDTDTAVQTKKEM